MLSPFGKFTRKLRIDSGKLLKDMADDLGVTTSYLSAAEVGKRTPPQEWENVIVKNYNLDANDREELSEAIYNSQKTIKLTLDKFSDDDKDIMLSFARRFNDLGEDEKNNIKSILNNARNK